MGTNYYDPWLFRATEESLGMYWPNMKKNLQYIDLPTTTYAQYKAEVTTQYNNLSPLLKTVCDYHMSALTEVVSSGVTTDPDYWSASSVNGSYIINSGLTTSRVGIGTMNPPYTLTVSGVIGINEYIYHNGDANTYIRLQDDHLNLVAGGKSMVRLDMGATQDKVEINNTNADIDFRVMDDNGDTILSTDAENTRVGVNNIIPNHALSVSGAMSASSHVYVGDDLYVDMIRRASSNSTTTKIKNNANNWETYAGSSSLWSTKVLSHELQVGQNGAGFISAQTINAPVLSATTLHGTIDGGSF